MARKSRKQNDRGVPVDGSNSAVAFAAGYVRLSVTDRDHKGNSIETQKHMIQRYIDEHSELRLYEMYVDDGISGSTLERPAFSRMIKDAESGRFRYIIVKDASRFSRNVIDTGYYVEQYLPSIGIGFISIGDEYDSTKNPNGISFIFRNVVNEAYSIDTRKKITTVLRHLMREGSYIGGRPPFGYLKSLGQRHQLVVDEPAAQTVRRIFQMAANGETVSSIVRSLNKDKVMTPSQHRFRQGMIRDVGLVSNIWRRGTISKILSDEVYLGNMVQGKTKVLNHRQHRIPSVAWIRAENTHRPIITRELYDAAQSGRRILDCCDDKKPHNVYSPNLFRGKIFCACCGGRMDRKQNHDSYAYRCTAHYGVSDKDCGVHIGEDHLMKMVSDSFIRYAKELPEEPPAPLDKRAVQSELARLQIEMSSFDDTTKELYENRMDGNIAKQEYDKLRKANQQAQTLHMQRMAELSRQQTEQRIVEAEWLELKNTLHGFQKSLLLTQELIDKWIERVGVGAGDQIYVEFVVL
ncbi:MAG TPA: hypothetical protein DEQ02_10250 [Ruminococcaceae bacterium]|nr:hypothetical protein [Oscillospiraceae bacterium]